MVYSPNKARPGIGGLIIELCKVFSIRNDKSKSEVKSQHSTSTHVESHKTWQPKSGDKATLKWGNHCREESYKAQSAKEQAYWSKQADRAADDYDNSIG